jgi:DNA-binding GntR family transcriptional regulator
MVSVNRDFHLAIARAGRNRYYAEFFARLLDEGQRLLRLYYSTFEDHLPREFVDEHEAIVAAIARRDEAEADRLAGAHAMGVVRQIQDSLANGIASDVELAPPIGG